MPLGCGSTAELLIFRNTTNRGMSIRKHYHDTEWDV
jgi:hypothetical protein